MAIAELPIEHYFDFIEKTLEENNHIEDFNHSYRSCLHKLVIRLLGNHQGRRSILSKITELENLMKEKSGLEEESRRLDEEQKKLNLRAKALYEKLIQEMKKKNTEKQQTVSQLQAKIDNLEAQLDKLSLHEVREEIKVEKDSDIQDEILPEASEAELIEADESVTVAEIEEEIELTSGHGRKKRKFF